MDALGIEPHRWDLVDSAPFPVAAYGARRHASTTSMLSTELGALEGVEADLAVVLRRELCPAEGVRRTGVNADAATAA